MKFSKIAMTLIILALFLTVSCSSSNDPGLFPLSDFESEISVKYGDIEVMNGENFMPDGVRDINKPLEIVFTVENFGKANLRLIGSPLVSITGSSLYKVTREPSETIKTGESTSFTISFEPTGWGNFPVTVSIPNNDTDEGGMSFVLNGSTLYQWAKTIGNAQGYEDIRKIAMDSNGNLFIAGHFNGTLDFDPSEEVDNQDSEGNSDIFLTKLNSDGSYAWTASMGDASYDRARGIAIDSSDNVFITGYFNGSVDFNPTSDEDRKETAIGKWDTFLTKFKNNGAYEWTLTFGGPDTDNSEGTALAIDPDGNIFITGWFRGTVDFDPDPVNDDVRDAVGESDIFITKINSSGAYGWTVTAGSNDNDHAEAIALDSDVNIITAGCFQETVDFDPGSGEDNKISEGLKDTFFWKIDKNGNHLWSRTIGSYYDDEFEGSIIFNSEDDILASSSFEFTMDFDPTAGTDKHETDDSNGNPDSYLLKLYKDGSYGWTKTIKTKNSDHVNLSIDPSGSIFITSSFRGEVDFDPDPAREDFKSSTKDASENYTTDIFISEFGPEGSYKRTLLWGSQGLDRGDHIISNSRGDFYLTGKFSNTIDLNPGESQDLRTSEGLDDLFILKLRF